MAKTLSNQNYDLNIEGGSRNYPHFKRYNSITYNKEMDNDMGIEIIKKVRRRRFLG